MLVKLNKTSLNTLISSAEKMEEKLYNDIIGTTSSHYQSSELEKVIKDILNDYIYINNIKIKSGDVVNYIKDPNFLKELEELFKGEDALLSTHRNTMLFKNSLDDFPLVNKIRKNIEDKFKKGYATELLTNIVLRGLGERLDKKSFNIDSTSYYTYSHSDERIADIELSYVDKNGLKSMVKFDSKQNLNNFHITELDNIQERYNIAMTKESFTNPIQPTEYERVAKTIVNLLIDKGFTVKEDKKVHLGGGVYDWTVVYEINQDAAQSIVEEILRNKYGSLTSPLLFNSYDIIDVKSLSSVLKDLLNNGAYLYYPNGLIGGGTYNTNNSSDYKDIESDIKEAEQNFAKRFNKFELWYGKKQ